MKGNNVEGKTGKCLVAYFSRPGDNYVGGKIVNLPIGNTEIAAKMIQQKIGCDLFRIEPVRAYPKDYTETTEVAKEELRAKARPQIASQVENIASYDLIFLGYPNWWGTMPMPVFTFLEGYNLSSKTIAPFCTHEGSGLGHSVTDLRNTCKESTILDGLAIRGGDVKHAQNDVDEWIRIVRIRK